MTNSEFGFRCTRFVSPSGSGYAVVGYADIPQATFYARPDLASALGKAERYAQVLTAVMQDSYSRLWDSFLSDVASPRLKTSYEAVLHDALEMPREDRARLILAVIESVNKEPIHG